MSQVTDIKSFIVALMGSNPYEGFDASGYVLDVTGWQSHHPLFEAIINQIKPRLILEVGTWKGASAIHMARLARKQDPAAQVLCVDTWLGSHRVLWMNPELRKQLNLKHGYPQQYFQFLANVLLTDLQDAIFPLPMTSYSATNMIANAGLEFDLVYIDAHHDEDEVAGDLRRCYPLLRPGGIMFGDDYSGVEPGVIKAVNRFAAEGGLYLSTAQEKWAVRKPG
jgi:SAM-dependent methyltransferase